MYFSYFLRQFFRATSIEISCYCVLRLVNCNFIERNLLVVFLWNIQELATLDSAIARLTCEQAPHFSARRSLARNPK